MVVSVKYYNPTTAVELLELLEQYGESGKILAGGTDLLVDMRAGLKKPAALIDIKKSMN